MQNGFGTRLVSYTYDAWGNHVVTPYNDGENIIAVANNPIRYRGYYYDTDLGLYYLQTRYYDSNTGRFINADDVTNLGVDQNMFSYNLYAYCSNNPVNYDDPSGESILGWAIFIIGAAVAGGIIGGIAGAEDDNDDLSVAEGIVGGAIILGSGAGLITATSGVAISLFGLCANGVRIAALGALSYNIFPIFLAPFVDVEVEAIEISPSGSPAKTTPPKYTHPAVP